jgi:hypothetical protein
VNEKLGELLARVERAIVEQEGTEEELYSPEPVEESRINPKDEREIERLFEEAEQDRSKAYELKRKLDQLDVFKEYEDRFLDLFKDR